MSALKVQPDENDNRTVPDVRDSPSITSPVLTQNNREVGLSLPCRGYWQKPTRPARADFARITYQSSGDCWKCTERTNVTNRQSMRSERNNPNARNFGLQSRDMGKAGLNALKEGMKSHSSVSTMSSRFNQFAEYSRHELNIRDMRQLEQQHIQQYANHLKDRVSNQELSVATAQNYLSAVNRVMEIARGDKTLHVSAVKDAGFEQRSNIRTENKAIPEEKHQNTVTQVDERLGIQLELQRNLGLRFEESCKLNADKAYNEAITRGSITVSEGTKGGRDRIIPTPSQKQLETLENAARIQGDHFSLIPKGMSYQSYQDQCYNNAPDHFQFHGERHFYAQERYEQLTGCQSPVAAGIEHRAHHQYMADQLGISKVEAREIDHSARSEIAEELGHGRMSITNNYLG